MRSFGPDNLIEITSCESPSARKLEQKRKQNPQRKIPRTELLPVRRFNTDPGTNSVRHISCEPLCLSDFVGVG